MKEVDWEIVLNYFEGFTLIAGVILFTEYLRYTPLTVIGDVGVGTFSFIATENALRQLLRRATHRQ